MNRRRFPKDVEVEVLTKCRRACALCFGLDGDASEKDGQVAHVDRNPSNASLDNAAFLCAKHHARYDSRSRQTKGFGPGEVKTYQRLLFDCLAHPGTWLDARVPTARKTGRRPVNVGVSLEVYDRRLPVYKTATEFVRSVLSDMRPELPLIFKFVNDTEEVLFLFDAEIAQYLKEIFSRAIRLHSIALMLGQPDHNPSLWEEQTKVATWFSEQFEEIRTRLAPFLRLA